jgi:acyl-CoA thioester hydrolase
MKFPRKPTNSSCLRGTGPDAFPFPISHLPFPSSVFSYHRRVQFAETDLAGQVHFSWMFRYMEEAEHALWRSLGLTIAERGSELGWPRIAASMDFRSPLHFEDEIEVRLHVAAVKTRTIEYVCSIHCGDRVAASGRMSSICVRRVDGHFKASEIPAPVAARLNNLVR